MSEGKRWTSQCLNTVTVLYPKGFEHSSGCAGDRPPTIALDVQGTCHQHSIEGKEREAIY